MNFLVPVKIGQKPFRTSNNSANNRKQVVLVWFVYNYMTMDSSCVDLLA